MISIRHSLVVAFFLALLFGILNAQEKEDFKASDFNLFYLENSSSNQTYYYEQEQNLGQNQNENFAVFVNIDSFAKNNEIKNQEERNNNQPILKNQFNNFKSKCTNEQFSSVFLSIEQLFLENNSLNESKNILFSDECYLLYFIDSSIAKNFDESNGFFTQIQNSEEIKGAEIKTNSLEQGISQIISIGTNSIQEFTGSILRQVFESSVYPKDNGLSIEMWIKTDDKNDAVIATSGEYSNENPSYWTIAKSKSGNDAVLSIKLNKGEGEFKYTGKTNIADGRWHYLALIMNSNFDDLELYLDDQLEIKRNFDFSGIDGESKEIVFGNSHSSQKEYFIGNIYGFKLYNYVLTPIQIDFNFNEGKAFLEGSS